MSKHVWGTSVLAPDAQHTRALKKIYGVWEAPVRWLVAQNTLAHLKKKSTVYLSFFVEVLDIDLEHI